MFYLNDIISLLYLSTRMSLSHSHDVCICEPPSTNLHILQCSQFDVGVKHGAVTFYSSSPIPKGRLQKLNIYWIVNRE